jgi:ubiquinone/menaquinone biosynthesis C-methylase UbiE/uncharacterized protein YbaR (Trm112 family)
MHYAGSNKNMTQSDDPVEYCCPICRGTLDLADQLYKCARCRRDFPIFFGIPDFRIKGDAYLSLEDERDKAGKLAARAASGSFEKLLDYYYSITDDVTPDLAARYRRYVLNGPDNAKHLVAGMDLERTDILLDAGCGTGSFSIAARASVRQLYALDIALRWLIICRKRFEETGLAAQFVCADICNLPFPDGSFDAVAAVDVLEHTHDPMTAIDATIKVLAPESRMCITGTNRYVLGPHPSGRIWFAGYMPRALRSWTSKLFRGYDSLRHTRLISPFAVRARLKKEGITDIQLWPRRIGVSASHGYSASARWLIRVYRWISEKALLRPLMIAIGPSFELIATKPSFADDEEGTTK